MKKMFMSLVALACATVSFAQSSMLATLNHQGSISTYYGATALGEAYKAAAHGDVITLSSGTFVATNISKAITVRGAGMGIDTTQVVEPTVISGDFTIDIADSVSNKLTLEGIYSNHTITYKNLRNASFLKSRLKKITDYSSTTSILKDANIIHCRIADELRLANNSSALCINSVIEDPHSYSSTTANFEFVNCVIVVDYYNLCDVKSSSFKNCLLKTRLANGFVDGSCTAYNCVGVNSSSIFKYITNSTNRCVSSYADVFKTYAGSTLDKLDNERFELTDVAKTTYLGMDGTQVGIYGGNLPFDATPSNPQITKCNVAAKSTADGKLSVDIQVKAAE